MSGRAVAVNSTTTGSHLEKYVAAADVRSNILSAPASACHPIGNIRLSCHSTIRDHVNAHNMSAVTAKGIGISVPRCKQPGG